MLYDNYAGDNTNVKMASKLVAKAGTEVLTVIANDDVSSAPAEEREKRRGVAGEIFMWKIGGAKAASGAFAEEVQAAAQQAIDACRSVGVGFAPCTLPAVGHPNFQIEPGLGATARNELYVLYDRMAEQIEARGLNVHKAYVDDYFTLL